MTLFELTADNLKTGQSSSAFQLGAQPDRISSGGGDTSSFSSILGSRIGRAYGRADIKTTGNTASVKNSAGPESLRTENKPKYLTFREARDADLRKTALNDSRAAGGSAVEEPDGRTDDVAGNRKTDGKKSLPENFLDICAQLLGIGRGELQKLLEEAGVTAESFADAKSVREAAADLSRLLGLNGGQAAALEDLFLTSAESLGLFAAGQAKDASEAAAAENAGAKGDETSKTSGIAAETAASGSAPNAGVMFGNDGIREKLAEQIGMKLDEISFQAGKDNSTVAEELKDLMRPLLEKAAAMARAASQQGTGTADADGRSADTEAPAQAQAAAVPEEATEEGSSETKGDRQEAGAKTGQNAVIPQSAETVKEAQPQVQYPTVQDYKAVLSAAAEKTAEASVKPREIISQILEKATVILSPEKSEMVMDLKPDSLGKLSLKVVTENGIVMAKFVAENQQVRQILESNMQLLKDSLEKQGMNVQGFSVSVRQDPGRSDTDRAKYGRTGGLSDRRVRNLAGLEGQTAGIFETAGGSDPYQWEGSTINLTA